MEPCWDKGCFIYLYDNGMDIAIALNGMTWCLLLGSYIGFLFF